VKPSDWGGGNSISKPAFWFFLIGVAALLLFLEAATTSRFSDKVRLAIGVAHLLPTVLGMILLTGCVAGIGSAFFSLFSPNKEESSWLFFVHLGIGIGVVQIVLTLVGYAHLLYIWPLRILFLVLIGVSYRHVLDSFKNVGRMISELSLSLRHSEKIEWLFFGVLCLQIFFWLVYSLSPPTGASALGYHLAQPKAFLDFHLIYSRPDYYESTYPFGFEIWILFHFLFTDEIGTRFSLFLIGVGVLVLVTVLAHRFQFSRSPFLVPALLANLIEMNETVFRMENDLFGLFFLCLGLLSIHLWKDTGRGEWWIPGWAAFGIAISVKYPFLFPVFLCLLLTGYWYVKGGKETLSYGKFLSGIGLFLFLGGFWYFKNGYFLGNPLYPFQLFGWIR